MDFKPPRKFRVTKAEPDMLGKFKLRERKTKGMRDARTKVSLVERWETELGRENEPVNPGYINIRWWGVKWGSTSWLTTCKQAWIDAVKARGWAVRYTIFLFFCCYSRIYFVAAKLRSHHNWQHTRSGKFPSIYRKSGDLAKYGLVFTRPTISN